jgi:hypothetical protein
MAAGKPALHQPESLTAKPFGAIPGYCVPKTAGKRKAYPVIRQIAVQYKELRAPAAEMPALAKNLPNLVPFL